MSFSDDIQTDISEAFNTTARYFKHKFNILTTL